MSMQKGLHFFVTGISYAVGK